MATLADLSDSLAAAGIPIVTVRSNGAIPSVVYAANATAPQIAAGNALAAAWVPSTANDAARSAAKALLANNGDGTYKLLRAVALVLLDEVNVLRAAMTPPLTARTAAQMIAALKAKVDSGAAD